MKKTKWTINRITTAIVIIAGGVGLILIINPIRTTMLKAVIVLLVLILLLSPFVYFRKKLKIIIPLAVAYLMIAIFLLLPGRDYNTVSIRQRYIANLAANEGLPFIWGGESLFGTDCSGLVRKEFVNSLIYEGIFTLNPALIRKGLYIWRYDCNARALKDGYKDFTYQISSIPNVNATKDRDLMLGDLAVMDDGAHVMAYIGNNKWIEADPDKLNVLRITVPSDNPWFSFPAKIVRWSALK
jgi:Ca2+/Na+ antiporter